MSPDDEDELLFGGTTGEIEAQMRQLLRAMQIEKDGRQLKILSLKLSALKDQLLSESSGLNEFVAPLTEYEDSSATFEGDIGQIERTLRLSFENKKSAITELQSTALQCEIDACVDLLRSPLVQSSGPQMIAYKRVWEYLRLGSLPALLTVDPLILRAVRDNTSGHSLLHKAALLGSPDDLLNHLVNVGKCDVNAVDHIGQTPMHVAIQVGNLPTAKRLLELKADVSIQDMARRTPLHSASRATIDYLLGHTLPATGTTSTLLPFIPSEWEIQPQQLERRECIGEGASGRVYSGSYKETAVAIKEVLISGSLCEEKGFKKEVEILTKLRHPNLVLFMGISILSTLQVVTELCSGGSVHSYLHEDQKTFSPAQILRASIDTLSGLVYLHSNDPPILHMDLKSRNLLLQFPPTENFLRIKIADFGISRVSSTPQAFAGTWWWMSPEVLFGEPVSDRSDIYSFAMCMYEIMSGTIPYQDIPDISEMPPVTVQSESVEGCDRISN